MKDFSQLITKLSNQSDIAKEAAEAIDYLLKVHQMDLSEKVTLRRQIQFLMEEREDAHA